MAGSVTTAILTGRERRRAAHRKTLRALDRRLTAIEIAAAQTRAQTDALAVELQTDERKHHRDQ